MKPKIIKTEAEHAVALTRIEQIFDAQPGTPEGDELELLTMLVDQYEKAAFPIGLPDPVTAIRFRLMSRRFCGLITGTGGGSASSEGWEL